MKATRLSDKTKQLVLRISGAPTYEELTHVYLHSDGTTTGKVYSGDIQGAKVVLNVNVWEVVR